MPATHRAGGDMAAALDEYGGDALVDALERIATDLEHICHTLHAVLAAIVAATVLVVAVVLIAG